MLPLKFVKEIHSRLAVRYGSSWRGKWAEVPQEALEADWADQLAGMQSANIRKALESLPPDFPPTAPAFRLLGVIREEAAPLRALPAPDADGLKRIAQSMSPALEHMGPPREWMAQLQRDVLAGNASKARISHFNLAMANGYYGNLPQADGGDFTPVPDKSLPPGMRAAAGGPATELPAWATEQ